MSTTISNGPRPVDCCRGVVNIVPSRSFYQKWCAPFQRSQGAAGFAKGNFRNGNEFCRNSYQPPGLNQKNSLYNYSFALSLRHLGRYGQIPKVLFHPMFLSIDESVDGKNLGLCLGLAHRADRAPKARKKKRRRSRGIRFSERLSVTLRCC